MSHSVGLQVLQAKIRGFHAAGRSIHLRIQKAKGRHRANLWYRKHMLGRSARVHMVAYGLLRGIKYELIEQCAPTNKVSAEIVFEIMKTHNAGFINGNGWCTPVQNNLTLEWVKDALKREPLRLSVSPTLPTVELP